MKFSKFASYQSVANMFLMSIVTFVLFTTHSFAQSTPFNQYLESIKASRAEPALLRVAQECGVDLNTVAPHYADLPDNTWILVKDLAKSVHGIESDFFATAAVWHQSDRILVELWEMQLDAQIETRSFYCLNQRKIKTIESLNWTLPEVMQNGIKKPGWGHEQHWKVTETGNLERIFQSFIDFGGNTINEPKLDAQARKDLLWKPTVRRWNDLELPSTLLQ
ncbi:MAG: hypothetical protein WAN35_13090 [Terracidiphilus sp.]